MLGVMVYASLRHPANCGLSDKPRLQQSGFVSHVEQVLQLGCDPIKFKTQP